jgi:hypothetical protein
MTRAMTHVIHLRVGDAHLFFVGASAAVERARADHMAPLDLCTGSAAGEGKAEKSAHRRRPQRYGRPGNAFVAFGHRCHDLPCVMPCMWSLCMAQGAWSIARATCQSHVSWRGGPRCVAWLLWRLWYSRDFPRGAARGAARQRGGRTC